MNLSQVDTLYSAKLIIINLKTMNSIIKYDDVKHLICDVFMSFGFFFVLISLQYPLNYEKKNK